MVIIGLQNTQLEGWDAWTDKQIKLDLEVGAPPKKEREFLDVVTNPISVKPIVRLYPSSSIKFLQHKSEIKLVDQ